MKCRDCGKPVWMPELRFYKSTDDGALIIEIDTNFEPNEQGVRVWLNNEEFILATAVAAERIRSQYNKKGSKR